MSIHPVTEQQDSSIERNNSPISWVKERVASHFLRRKLETLRNEVHSSMKDSHERRLSDHIEMTEEEKRLGVYLEDLEPQVREAIRVFNAKGYSTDSSGFFGKQSNIQSIEGHFQLDGETKGKLKKMGIAVSEAQSWKYKVEKHQGTAHEDIPDEAKHLTVIQFRPKKADLLVITNQWNEIAALLPDKGAPAMDWYRSKKS